MYFNFENYESKGGSKEHFLNSFTKNYDLENDTYERVQKGIENFNKENNTSFDLYDYLKFNSKKIKFKKKEPLQEQGKEDLNEDLAEQKEPLQDENLEENKSFKRKHDLSKESEILNDTSLLSDVKNSLKRGAETLSDVVGLDELVNFDSDIKSKADENIKDLIKQGASYEDLNELEKNYLANKESRENVRDATNIFSKEKSIKGLASLYGTNEEEKAKKAFAEMKSTQEALSKEKFEDLNEQEKELIDKERGAVESFFVNLRDDEYKQKSFDELKEKYEAKNFISKDVLRDLEFLKNIHQSKSVSSLILSADEKEKKDYENSVLNIALNAGFDDVLVDEKEGKMYFEKEGQKYLVNEGFFDNFTNTLLANTGSITGGLIGAAKGASSAKSPQSALAKSIAYSALGSGIGASADVLATNYLLDRKNRFDEMLHHALEESALSAVGDALVLGAKPLLKTAKDSIKDFGKILDYTPLVSTTKNFPTQNIKAAQDLVEKSVDLNTQKELDEFYKAYGGRSDLADSKALDALVDTFKAKFGEDSFISKNTQRLNDILNLNSLSAKQNALFEAIRADESGFLLPYVKEVASYDVRAFKNLKNILNLSTQRLENSLKNMNLNKGDIKGILDDLEKGTKEDYNEVMNEILAKTYDDRFKVVLNRGEAEENVKNIKANELKEVLAKMDLSPQANANKKERFLIGKIGDEEAKILQKEFNFKGKKPLVREIDSHQIIHTLKQHGDEALEKERGNIAVNLDDIATYQQYTKDYDLRIKQDNGKIIYAKQVNGHYVVVEEVLSGQDKLRFFDMWKGKGKINKDVLLSRSVTPEATSSHNLDSVMTKAQEPKILTPQGEAITPLSQKPSVFLDSTSAEKSLSNADVLNPSLARSQVPLYSDKEAQTLLRGYKPDANSFASSKQNYNILNLKTQAKDEDFFNERLKIQELLTEQKGEVVNKNTNETAQLSNKGIKKMLSDKAISKSVDNGFSKMEHLQAVANIKTLFENSQKSLIKSDKVDDKLKIYRYKSDFNINDKDAQALITIKEYDENGKKLYSLELDELVPNKLKSRGESLSGNTSNRPHGTPSSASGSEIPTSQNNYTTFRKNLQEQGLLENMPSFTAPKDLNTKEIEELIKRFDNVENLKKHLNSRPDAKERMTLFSLLDTTMQEPQLKWLKDGKDKRLKKFKNENDSLEPYFYLLVTKDKDKTFITHLKTKDLKYLNKELQNADEILKGADIIEGFRQQAGSANNGISPSTSKSNYTKFRQELQEQGLLDEEAMKFLNYVENTIYNPKGVTFTQLNNALKNINSFYKQSTNPGFKEHIKNAVQSFLREDIKKGINEIFKQDKNLYAKASKLYETSLAEYAQMKELLKASAYKKARNESTTQVKALDELIKYSKGQGKDGLNNLDFLRAKLDEKDVAVLEMNLLNRLYEKSLANTDESLRVFDSTSFLNELSSLQNNAFKSKEANEFIELVKGFDKLFKNDAKIALELAPVTAKKEGSALATSAKGAVLQKIVKSGFDLVFRNLGQNVLFGSFKDQIQGAALRYHLKKALQKSDTISEFNTSFKDRLKKGQFNSKTRELSKDFLNDVENFSKSLDDEVLKDTKASDESLKDLPKDLQEQWIKEFNLKSVDDEFIPNFKPEVKEALEKAGITEDLHLKIGSLIKLNNRQRQEFLPYIKPTIQEPNLVLDDGRGILFIKEFTGEDKSRYFMSVAKDYNGEWIFSTHTRKELKAIQNKINNSKQIYNKGFKGEEVAGTSDILKSGGTTTKPSDLQIEYPANHSSGINPKDNSTTNVASLSKTRELSKDFLNDVENFSKSLDDEVLKDTKASDESLKDLPKIGGEIEIKDKENFLKDYNLTQNAIPAPAKINIDEFLQGLEFVKNKENFIEHLKSKDDANARLAYLNLVEPTLKEWDIKLTQGEKEIFIKPFYYFNKDNEKEIFYLLSTKDKGQTLLTGLPTGKENYIKAQIKNSDKVEVRQWAISDLDTTTKDKFANLQSNSTTNLSKGQEQVEILQAKKQEVLNKIKSKEHKEYLRLQTKLEESKQLEAQALKELEPIKQRIISQTKAKEFYAQALEKLDISAFGYQIKDELKPIFSTIKKARRGQEHYTERLFSYPLKKLQGKSLTFNEKEFPLYENALTLKQSHSIDKNPKLIKERVALRKALETHLDIKPIKEFGTNYAEHYRDGTNAIAKILSEAKDYEARKEAGELTQEELKEGSFKGQVAGAFYKEGLGDIDLVWGEAFTNKKGEIDGFGLSKILEKHAKNGEFKEFGGDNPQTQMQNALIAIIAKGEVIDENGRKSIVLNYNDKVYRLGLKGNWKGQPTTNKWIITAYEDREATKFIPSDDLTKGEALPLNSKEHSSTNSIKLQANSHIGTGNTKKDFDLSNKDDMQELKAFFHTHSTDTQEAKELFNLVLEQAQHFKIKVNFTNDLPRGASGEYDKYYLVKILDDYHPEYKAQTLFHELIHSVTTNAIMLVNVRTHLDKTTLLHPKQIEAVNTITTIYKDIKTKFPKFSAVSRNYGMKNEFEFVAELANPEFRDKLKKLNVFEKIVDAITKIVVYLKDSVRGYGKPTGNVYEKTKNALIDIIDNYDKDFLEKYIKTYERDRRKDTSHYNLKLGSKFLNEKGEIDFKTLESEAVTLPKALKFSAFKESILQSSNAKPQSNNKVSYKTIIGDININLSYTYSHFFKNGNGKENRFNLTGALTHILDNPLFVTKDKKGAYYFYKPFKDEKGFKHLVSISVDKNGKIEYRTSYEASNTRLKQMIKMHELAYLKE